MPVFPTPTAAVPAHPTVVHGLVLPAPMAVAVPVPTPHPPSGPTEPPVTPFLAILPASLGVAPAPVIPMVATSQSLGVDALKLLQLDPIKDAKSYLTMYKVIQLYLGMDIFSQVMPTVRL